MSIERPYVRTGLLALLVAGAAFAMSAFLFAPAPVSAATLCPATSTQSSCACPTSGPGVTCVGGQLYASTTQSCYNDPRSCASNQVLNCDSGACVCDTANYPCGGCTAPTSTVGASAPSPTGSVYTNQCGATACPSGTQLCSSSNTCVAVISCPAGTTFDPCTDSCTTPYVLLSPSWDQAGNIRITGNVTSTSGDVYMADGKAVRVDGSGTTTLNIGNWGSGATGLNLTVFGDEFADGISTVSGDTSVPAGAVHASSICFGAGTNCRTSWPSASDFNSLYVNTTGADSMSGPLTINGTGTDLFLTGGGTSGPKMSITAPTGMEGLQIVSASDTSPFVIRNSGNTADLFAIDQTGTLTAGNVPWTQLSAFPSACPTGQFVHAIGGSLTCAAAVGGSGTTNYLSKWTSSSALGNSEITDDGSTVSIAGNLAVNGGNITTSASTLNIGSTGQTITLNGGPSSTGCTVDRFGNLQCAGDISSTTTGGTQGWWARTSGVLTPATASDPVQLQAFRLTTGAAAGDIMVSDASGNASWTAPTYVSGSGTAGQVPVFTGARTLANSVIYAAGSNVGIGAPSSSYRLYVDGLEDVKTGLVVGGATLGSGDGIDTLGANNGIVAKGTSSYGVYGTGGYAGVYGGGGYYGVYGTGSTAGVFGGGSGYGLWGQGTSAGIYYENNSPLNSAWGRLGYKAGSTYFGINTAVNSGTNGVAGLFQNANNNAIARLAGYDSSGNAYAGYFSGGDVWMTGKLGVGTTTPSYQVDVNGGGNDYVLRAGNGNAYLTVFTGGDTNLGLGNGSGYDAGSIAGMTNSSGENVILINGCDNSGNCPAATYFDQNGHVGIGIQSPQYPLDIQGTARFSQGIGVGGWTPYAGWGVMAAGTTAGGDFSNSNTGAYVYLADNTWGLFTGSPVYFGGGITSYGTSNFSSSTLVVDSGNSSVGVGTASPSYKLDVNGTMRATYINLGGVSRSTWPSLAVTTQYCTLSSTGSWQACSCPAGYTATGWSGYNCRYNGSYWPCDTSYPYGNGGFQFYVTNNGGTAYVELRCMKLN